MVKWVVIGFVVCLSPFVVFEFAKLIGFGFAKGQDLYNKRKQKEWRHADNEKNDENG